MRIYFMSICGTGMGNAALLLREAGHDVFGCDQNIYPPMSEVLAQAGIEVLPGFDAARLERLRPDLVVVGNVNARGNPEIEWLLETRALPYASLPETLSRLVLSQRKNVVVTGTHGKTTTTSLIAYLLRASGRAPGWMVGGVSRDLPAGYDLGKEGDPFVIEGDEYDSAFFDKRSKFIHYAPHVAVLNNLEFDHADIFRDLDDVKRTFAHFLRIVPRNGWIVYNGDDANLSQLLPVAWARSVSVGVEAKNDLRIRAFSEGPTGARFQLIWRGTPWGRVTWSQPGLYNARNAAVAALAAGLSVNPEDPFCAMDPAVLKNFRGVHRRQEVLYEGNGTVVVTDFAHHPTAIRETLRSLRARYPGLQLTLAWEARSNTACRRVLQDAFGEAFAMADRVHLGAIFRMERYPEDERIDLPAVASRLGERASVHPDNAALEAALAAEIATDSRQCIVFCSNGSFDGVPARVVEALSRRQEPGGDASHAE